MEVTFIQRVLQVRLHCGPYVKVLITENRSSKCYCEAQLGIQLCHFWDYFQWKDMEKILPIFQDKIAYNSTIL